MVKVDERGREAERCVCQLLRCSELHVDGHVLVGVVIRLELSAEVLCNKSDGQVAFRVIIVESEVHAHAYRVVVADVGGYKLCRYAARQAVREHVGEIACKRDVLCRELARLRVVFVHLLHRAIAHELCRHRPRRLLLDHAVEGGTCCVDPRHVVHVVEAYRLVAHRREKGRVVENQSLVVLDNSDVVATQGSSMRAYGQAQEIIFGLTFLCRGQNSPKYGYNR